MLALQQHNLHNKSSKVCINARSPAASQPFVGLVAEQTTVKWPILPYIRQARVVTYHPKSLRFFSHGTGTSYTINRSLDCNSRNIVYLISCKVCGFQYVGSTTTKFRLSFNNHAQEPFTSPL